MSPKKPSIPLIPESEYTMRATRSSGPGGQHVNKVSTAIVLRFDIHASSLPVDVKERLLASRDNRISAVGVLVIKVDTYRSQLRNKEAALSELYSLIRAASKKPKKRKPTKPTGESVEKRLEEKSRKGKIKSTRRKVEL